MITPDDERAILNNLGEFARIIDRREWHRVGDVFADDIVFDYGGDASEQRGSAALKLNFMRFLDNCGPSQHLLGSVQLEVDGNTVVTRAYVQARHQGKGAKSHLYLDTHGEYTDRWQRRPEGWRVIRRDAKWFIHRGDFSVLMP